MTPEQIPDEVVEAICKRLAPASLNRYEAREGITAALTAWPGVVDHPETPSSPRCLWLPLSTEARDDR